MGIMYRVALGATLAFLFTTPALAAPVGFVPSAGVWFSQDVFFADDEVKVLTVVVNNSYQKLDGIVGFSDNKTLLGSTAVSVDFEQAKQVSLLWKATQGDHEITVAFLSAQAVDLQGKTISVSDAQLTPGGTVLKTNYFVDKNRPDRS